MASSQATKCLQRYHVRNKLDSKSQPEITYRVPLEQPLRMNPTGSGGLPNFLYYPARQRLYRRSLGALEVQRVMGSGIEVREAATHALVSKRAIRYRYT